MISRIFINICYQLFYRPVFNVLIIIFNALPDGQNLGTAIIIFTLMTKLALLPLSLMQGLSRQQRLDMNETVANINKKYADDPQMQRKMVNRIIKENRTSLIASFISIFIHIIITFIVYFIFTQGLKETGLEALYDSVPNPYHFNYIWLKINLSQPHTFLTLITCLSIFIERSLVLVSSPFPSTSDKFLQYLLPIGGFIVLSRLPSGLSLFLFTATLFGLFVLAIKEIAYWITVNFLTANVADADEDLALEEDDSSSSSDVSTTNIVKQT